MNRRVFIVIAAILLAAPALAQTASTGVDSTAAPAKTATVSAGSGALTVSPNEPFAKGRWHGSLVAGWGSSYDDSYVLLGAGIAYLAARGLEIGLDGETWLGHELGVSKLSPGIRKIFMIKPTTMPYLGAFYRRTFIDDPWEDYDSFGGRAGIYQVSGRNTAIGAGVVVEQYLDCDDDCTEVYPELSVSMSF